MKYPLSMRILHWTMALLIGCQLAAGAWMVRLKDAVPAKFEHWYPWHKCVGIVLFILIVARILIRRRSKLPPAPTVFARWERMLAGATHGAIYLLILFIPLMGYSMSSSFTQSDGVYFFGLLLPELLPKNDNHFEVFRQVHRWSAYLLLAIVVVHVLGAVKHRLFDRNRAGDVIPRMF